MKDIINIGVKLTTGSEKELKEVINSFINMKLICSDVDKLDCDEILAANDPVNYKIVYSGNELLVFGNKMIVLSLLNIFKTSYKGKDVNADIYFKMFDKDLMAFVIDRIDDESIIKETGVALDIEYKKLRDLLPARLNDVTSSDGRPFIFQFINGALELITGYPVVELMEDIDVMIMHHMSKKTKTEDSIKGVISVIDIIEKIVIKYGEATNLNVTDLNSSYLFNRYNEVSMQFFSFENFTSFLPQYEHDNDCKVNLMVDANDIVEGTYVCSIIPIDKLYKILMPNKMSVVINYDTDKSTFELAQCKGEIVTLSDVYVYDCTLECVNLVNCHLSDVTIKDSDMKSCIVSNATITGSYMENCNLNASVDVKESEMNVCNIYCNVEKSTVNASVIYLQADIDKETKINNSTKF